MTYSGRLELIENKLLDGGDIGGRVTQDRNVITRAKTILEADARTNRRQSTYLGC